MKNKFQRMNKEEKIEITKEFYKTEFGFQTKNRLIRILLVGIFSVFYTLYLIYDLIFNNYNIWTIILAIGFFIAAIVFITGYFKLKIKFLNNYAIKKK